MTEQQQPDDPRATDQPDDLPGATAAPQEDDAVVEDEYAEGSTTDPDGAERDAPAGEDYAGSGF
ncbi:hypothetical protein DT076_14005 [Desertihabitans brevis]|uniref:Uncharacterized protein n=1 Tax=Desertihabitans brevis TaxID=2268447 RepID=A0A367YSC4_9ACTN|nr:hypothetical protein [Desertihabitans brevis]RCK68700.1 hypothetical protein DT076_14005 [Desertihabitans brevis]